MKSNWHNTLGPYPDNYDSNGDMLPASMDYGAGGATESWTDWFTDPKPLIPVNLNPIKIFSPSPSQANASAIEYADTGNEKTLMQKLFGGMKPATYQDPTNNPNYVNTAVKGASNSGNPVFSNSYNSGGGSNNNTVTVKPSNTFLYLGVGLLVLAVGTAIFLVAKSGKK